MSLSLKVEVAFNAGFATDSGSRTWTDISSYVELQDGIDISFARRDEFSNADANTLSLTVDNSDGRFTPERSSSPYYPNVKLYRPIRVTATLPDSSTSVRFLGYVTQWPTEWQGGEDGYAKSTITASSRMARLGSTTALRSMLEEEILVNDPIRYYTMGDASDATQAADSTGAAYQPLKVSGSVTFGGANGPSGDSLTAVTFGTGGYLYNADGPLFPQSVVCFFLASSNITTPILKTTGDNPQVLVELVSGAVRVLDGAITSSGTYGDGAWHMVSISRTTGSPWTATAYVDISSIGTANVTPLTTSGIQVGGGVAGLEVAHVALYDSFVGSFDLTFIEWALDAFGITTTPDQLIYRLAAYAGIPSSEVFPSGVTPVRTAMDGISGKSVLDAMRDIESTEAGVLYDERNGVLTMTSRQARYNSTVAFTLDASSQHIGADFKPTYDETGLVNRATVTGPTTSAYYSDQGSVDDYGPGDFSTTTISSDDNEPMMLAGWRVNTRKQPRTRVGSLTVDVLPFASGTPSVMNIAAATVGTLIGVSNLPSQAAATSASYFVEGYTERFGVESWVITFNVSNSTPYLSTWVLDSGTRSQLDSTTILAL